MKLQSILLMLLAAALLGSPPSCRLASAQAAPPPAAASALVDVPSVYRIAPDDILSVTVVNFPAMLSVPQVVVVPDGSVSVPLLGSVSVAGKTTADVAQDLTRRWSYWVKKPAVTVSLMQKHRDHVYILGYVTHPGMVDLTPSLHVLDAVAEAGDALPNGDMSQLVLMHADGTKQTLDVTPAALRAGAAPNPLLLPGDMLAVPEQRAEFSVIGEALHPGSFNYKPEMTVLDALTAAGGVNKDSSSLREATLTHAGQTAPLDLDALLNKGDTSKNVKLAAGDQINIPKATRTYVYGAVFRSGFYNYTPGDKVTDALNALGGPTPEADYRKVHIVHINNAKGVAVAQQINMENFFKKGDLSADPVLMPGDAVFIESKEGPKPKWWEQLYGVGALASAVHILGFGL